MIDTPSIRLPPWRHIPGAPDIQCSHLVVKLRETMRKRWQVALRLTTSAGPGEDHFYLCHELGVDRLDR